MMNDNTTAYRKAQKFLNEDIQFHLGFLPTEQSNPKTENMDKAFYKDIGAGIKLLQSVDRNIAPMAERVFSEESFQLLLSSLINAVKNGHRIAFSGCGATGRLSIMLERCWRSFWNKESPSSNMSDLVISIMTGGDYALIKSVECFEDYAEFGRQQVREVDIGVGDVLVAITEGGETSSVLGTVDQALKNGCEVFLIFNNPADILCEHIERSRAAIHDPRVTVLDLSCGPMALAGSTRMQATTAELLVAGIALEQTCEEILHSGNREYASTAAGIYEKILTALESESCISAMSQWISIEEKLYRQGGLITYYADELMLDIFTDTTERSPTFSLPPFTRYDDTVSALPWAFVKNPTCDTSTAWRKVFAGRMPNCLEWTPELYRKMKASDDLISSPPDITRESLYRFRIGNEDCPERQCKPNACMQIALYNESLNKEFNRVAGKFDEHYSIVIGKGGIGDILFDVDIPVSPLMVWTRIIVKLILNTISTGTMVRMGRVKGNWMSCVDATNKKLIDRSIRLIAELSGRTYEEACLLYFRAAEEMSSQDTVVEYALTKLAD